MLKETIKIESKKMHRFSLFFSGLKTGNDIENRRSKNLKCISIVNVDVNIII